MLNNTKECKGCRLKFRCYISYHAVKNCPCAECIVKIMCKERCSDRGKYFRRQRDEKIKRNDVWYKKLTRGSL